MIEVAKDPKLVILLDELIQQAWRYGQDCYIDDIKFDEEGDSHNRYVRYHLMETKDKILMLLSNNQNV